MIQRLQQAAIDHHCHQANTLSHTVAGLTELVRQFMVSFGGVKPEAQDLSTYYPYPKWQPGGTPRSPEDGPTTEDVLRKLLADRRIPPHVFRELLTRPEQAS